MSYQILIGDAREQLATIPDGTVQTCVTSPPYYGLRDYGHDGQIGLEDTVDAYVQALVDVFREVRRVLRDDGTLWLNLGDSYATHAQAKSQRPRSEQGNGAGKYKIPAQSAIDAKWDTGHTKKVPAGLKDKDLIGIPWRVAFALQADGWYLRSEIIWSKPNPMPESVTDRPTKAHETVFLLSKRSTYYYDAAAIAEPAGTDVPFDNWKDRVHDQSFLPNKQASGVKGRPSGVAGYVSPGKRNKRSVWTVSTRPYSGAHFAVFPPKLIEPCILAGTSERGQCHACGAPWVRVVERENGYNGAGRATDTYTGQAYEHPQSAPRGPKSNFGPGNIGSTKGWAPSCPCDAGPPIPQTVLDPFAGSGTTGEVAEHHGRHAVLIELNPEYADLIRTRLAQRPLWDAMSVAD